MDSIGITGNPGTGKKTIASKLSEKIKMEIFDINKFIIENKYGQYEKNQLIISDINEIEDKIEHKIEKGIHEINRNLYLIESITDNKIASPKLYPTQEDFNFVEKYKNEPYICIAPTSVWFTKQFPEKKNGLNLSKD